MLATLMGWPVAFVAACLWLAADVRGPRVAGLAVAAVKVIGPALPVARAEPVRAARYG